MIGFRKGELITVGKIIQGKGKSYLEMGGRLIEAEIQGKIRPGEKLMVASVSSRRVLLKPYSAVFRNFAFRELLASLGLPENSFTRKMIQTLLFLEQPLSREKVRKWYSLLRRSEVKEKEIALPLLKGEWKEEWTLLRQVAGRDLGSLAAFFLELSSREEIFLPLDPDGSFLYIQPKKDQIGFRLFLEFSRLETVFVKGWASWDMSRGEGECYFLPYLELDFFNGLKKNIERQFPGFRIRGKHFRHSTLRGIDGIF